MTALLIAVVLFVFGFGCLMFWIGDVLLSPSETARTDLVRQGTRNGLNPRS